MDRPSSPTEHTGADAPETTKSPNRDLGRSAALAPDAAAGSIIDATRPGAAALLGLAAVLILGVFVAGAPDLDAPWVSGDEFYFIVDNPDVNPLAAQSRNLPASALPERLAHIWTHVHEDLYQPVPIVTYALEWSLTNGAPASFRRTDLALHALNALLLWLVLTDLFRRMPGVERRQAVIAGWLLALLWALHPAMSATYAVDMGRTHLLAAFFALLALWFEIQGLAGRGAAWYAAALVALLLAMLSKVLVGWVLLVLVLEATQLGWRRALGSWRVYATAAICATFAYITIYTSMVYGFMEDAAKGLFGDPVSRSALAAWIYFRDLLTPIWLSFWHLADPRTGWGYWRVWLGLLLALATVVHAVHAARRRETALIAVGWAWFWATLLPVIGLVGARQAAAADRYLYQPAMGLALVVGIMLLGALARRSDAVATAWGRRATVAGLVLAAAYLVLDLPQVALRRSVVMGAERLAEVNAGDPRALEALAAMYDFAQNHPLSRTDRQTLRERVGRDVGASQEDQLVYFNARWIDALQRAAGTSNETAYFPGVEDRAPFHRRLSYAFARAGDLLKVTGLAPITSTRAYELSLAQAEEARRLQPEAYSTWNRLAEAYQRLGEPAKAAEAFEQAERWLPDSAETRATYYTNCGWLLLFELHRDAEGCAKLMTATQYLSPTQSGTLARRLKVGLAECEIRYGKGERGYQLASAALAECPGDIQAGLVLGEYHLLSHNWEQAWKVYNALVHDNPGNYAALRGFQEACMRAGRREDASVAWSDAVRREPGRRELRSFLVWSLALAGDAGGQRAAADLLKDEQNNPLACYAMMLWALRTGDLPKAVEWIDRARSGRPVPEAREATRADKALQVLYNENKELPVEARAARAWLIGKRGEADSAGNSGAITDLEAYAVDPTARFRELARDLLARLSDPASQPTSENHK